MCRRHIVPQRRLQPRDLAMLASLAEGRFLLAEALEWLHFPSWRQRYRARISQQLPYTPSPHVYERLATLRDHSLISTIERGVELARREFVRLPAAYMLLQAGAELLAARQDCPIETLWWETPRKRSLQNVEHSVAIGTLYAALRCAAVHHDRQIVGWRGDHLLRDPRSYDRVCVVGQREPLPVQPDATFLLDGRRYFVELDRNTRPLVSWHDKALAYHAYRTSDALAARYTAKDFVLLIVTLSEQRARRIAEQVVKVTRAADGRYLLLDAARVHPTRIRANWMEITQVRREMQRVVNKLAEVYHPLLTPTALWSAPQETTA
jgi:hypothetical protein